MDCNLAKEKQHCKTIAHKKFRTFTTTLVLFLFLSICINAQPAVPRPVFQNFQVINLPSSRIKKNISGKYSSQSDPSANNDLPLGATSNDIIKQSQQQAMKQMGVSIPGKPVESSQQQFDELKQDAKQNDTQIVLQHFQNYLDLFHQLDPDSFSISKAVYLSEAVYYTKPPAFRDFEGALKQKATIVKQILKREGLSINNNSAINYGIQKLFSQDNIFHDTKTGKNYLVKKISYDFDDFNGEKDWANMFVTKVLQTNSGQCHSLPLLYLCIAEQLQAKAYLSLAPNHSFIQFPDSKGILHNFETTNGHITSTSWLLQSDAISTIAFKNRTYLDTLSSRKLFAQCLADFQMCYIMKNGYDNYTQQLSQIILSIDSTNINALMVNANAASYQFSNLHNSMGNPSVEQLSQYPKLEQAYIDMVAAQEKVNQTGYQDMPEEQYILWLKSVDKEKQKIKQKAN